MKKNRTAKWIRKHALLAASVVHACRGRSIRELLVKGVRLWNRLGWTGIRRWIISVTSYGEWVKRYDSLSESDLTAIAQDLHNLKSRPLISIVMPTYNTPEIWLRAAIDSVIAQVYTDWELCITDDASTEPHVGAVLREYVQRDNRINVSFREENGHISATSNDSLRCARGEFVALLDHDDELPAHALYMVAVAINEKPHLDLIYSDEDKIDESGQRYGPYFKPDWSPDLLTAQNVISHLGVYRTDIVRKAGGFRVGYEGSQDWDLALRVTEIIPASHIHHIPHVLYHWRAIPGSTASTPDEKPYTVKASMAAVQSHLDRCGLRGEIGIATGSYLRVRYELPDDPPLVSIIIQGHADESALARSLKSLLTITDYPRIEILLTAEESALVDLEHRNSTWDLKLLPARDSTRPQTSLDLAVNESNGDLLCLIQGDVEVTSTDWLRELASQAIRPGIGIVGPMLCSPNGSVFSAGMVLGLNGIAGDCYKGEPCGSTRHMGRASLVQNLSALNGSCLVVKKSVFLEAGGAPKKGNLSNYHNVDLCLRVRECGYRNLWTPFSVVTLNSEPVERARDRLDQQDQVELDEAKIRSRWSDLIENDPAYNPNLTLSGHWPFLAFQPRVTRPWLKPR